MKKRYGPWKLEPRKTEHLGRVCVDGVALIMKMKTFFISPECGHAHVFVCKPNSLILTGLGILLGFYHNLHTDSGDITIISVAFPKSIGQFPNYGTVIGLLRVV